MKITLKKISFSFFYSLIYSIFIGILIGFIVHFSPNFFWKNIINALCFMFLGMIFCFKVAEETFLVLKNVGLTNLHHILVGAFFINILSGLISGTILENNFVVYTVILFLNGTFLTSWDTKWN